MFFLNSAFDAYRDDRVALSIALVYPVFDLVVLTIAVVVLARAEARQRAALAVLTFGIGLVTIADSAFAYLLAGHRYDTGNLIDIVWAASLAAFGAAALLSRRTPAPAKPAMSVPSNSSLWLPYVPLLLAGTAGPLMIMSGLERIIVPFVVVAVCARQTVAAWENRRLLSAAADQALRDPLTGLANRTLFHDRLTHAMMLRSRDDRSVAVVSLDLDDFKMVNDSLGHPAADCLLVHVGQRLARVCGPVTRWHGWVATSSHSSSRAVPTIPIWSRSASPRPLPSRSSSTARTMLVRPSIGMAVAPEDEPDMAPEILIRRADMAMYAAKRSRSSEVHTFHAEMMLIEPDLVEFADDTSGRPAGNGAAKVRLLGRTASCHRRRPPRHGLPTQDRTAYRANRRSGGAAALATPAIGNAAPGAFVPLVRQHGLMRPVTALVVEKALDDAARWAASGVRCRLR